MPHPLRFRRVLLPLLAGLLLPAGASAAPASQTLCTVYGKLGAESAAFMLPQPFGELIAMMRGENADLLARFVQHLTHAMSGAELISLGELPEDSISLLGEAAGQSAVEMLMTARASNATEIGQLLISHCERIGPEQIIANQRAVKAAAAENQPQP